MDSLIAAAARALAAGDPLDALNCVALRKDPPALALRGIAMAQLGEYPRARELLRRAARAFGPREPVARARCVVAEAEVALASRELGASARPLEDACRALAARGDGVNAAHGRLVAVRRLLLLGQVERAEEALADVDLAALPPMLETIARLVLAEIALRRIETGAARAALDRALEASRRARIPALVSEVEGALASLETPAARMSSGGESRSILLEEVETVLASGALIVDACRRLVRRRAEVVGLSRRPVLFRLAQALESGRLSRTIDVACDAGTAFDGEHLYQLAKDRIQKIDPETGRVLSTIPAPGKGADSGLAWAEGTLWVGQYRERQIHQIDPATGEVLRTITSDRFVTGVTWVDGELWHGTWEAEKSDLRRIDPESGRVLTRLEMPEGTGVSGLECDGNHFFCGGGPSGKVRAVRRKNKKGGGDRV